MIVPPSSRAAVPAALGFQGATRYLTEAINTVGKIGRIFIISKEKDVTPKARKNFFLNRDLLKGKRFCS